MGWLRNWRRDRVTRHRRLPPAAWAHAEAALPILQRFDTRQRRQLEGRAVAFLSEKRFAAVAGARADEAQLAAIAIQAALPVLELGLDAYAPWTTVLLYPAGFVASHEYVDDDGIVHIDAGPLIGEAWEGGPLVLSLEDALEPEPGTCVVIHECAHKIDMLQGEANGLPPLPRTVPVQAWSSAFQAAFNQLRAAAEQLQDGQEAQRLPIDGYAAADPGEFFAVVSETYFADPTRLRRAFPEVYRLLERFYGALPLGRGC